MIVVDTSVFIDALFEYREDRTNFEIAFQTGCRAIDSFYIAVSHSTNSILVSNDKFQVESARKYGIKAFYLLEEFDQLEEVLNKNGGQNESNNPPLGH